MEPIECMGAVFISWRRRQAELLRRFGITFRQLALVRLARKRGGLTPSEAAVSLSCDRPTATIIARNCVAQGWLELRRSDKDGRSKRLILSGAGEELLDAIEASRLLGKGLGDPLDALDPGERLIFISALERVWDRAREVYGAGDMRSLEG